MSFAVTAAVVGVGATAYGISSKVRAQNEQERLLKLSQQTPRQRILYINTNLLPKARVALAKAQAGGDEKKIANAQAKLTDLQDEVALLQQTADAQHAQASGLFADVNAPTETPTSAPGVNKTLLIVGAGAAALGLIAALAASRNRK
jgi:hypothetical protein